MTKINNYKINYIRGRKYIENQQFVTKINNRKLIVKNIDQP